MASVHLLLALCLFLAAVISSSSSSFLVQLSSSPKVVAFLADHVDSADLLPQPDGRLQVILSQPQLELLASLDVTFEIVEKSAPLRSKLSSSQNGNDEMIPNGYLDLEGIWAKLSFVVNENPDILSFVNLTSYGPGLTFEGREMPMVKLSDNVLTNEDEPNILIVASHHAREIVNPHIVLDLIDRLVEGYRSNDTALRGIVEENEIFLSPLWNPDGYYHVWEVDNMWRKNRKPVGTGVYGVDQNRNYPYGWDSSCSGSSVPASDTYKGPSAASEEETKIIIEFSKTRNFAKVNDFHSYGREVLYGFVCDSFPNLLQNYISNEASILASKTTTRYATRTPSGDGQHQEWHIKEESAYSFLTETQTQFQPSYAVAEAEFDILWPMNLHFFQRAIPYSGHVLSSNGVPIAASITITQAPNVFWKSHERFGAYHLFLPDGQFTVTFSAPGYVSRTVTISISNASPVANQDIVLSRA